VRRNWSLEVLSPSNTIAEINEKEKLCLENRCLQFRIFSTLEAFGRGDIATILDACTEVIFPGERSIIPYAGEWKGKSRVADYFRVIGETVEVLKWKPQHVLGSGDRVAAFGVMDLYVKATGKTLINTPWALNFPLENGKLAGWQRYIDTAATEKAFTATAKASG
jgi:ketosteroid isomerase-like protein